MIPSRLEPILVCDKIDGIRLTIRSYPRNLSPYNKCFVFCACIFNFSFFTATDAVACLISVWKYGREIMECGVCKRIEDLRKFVSEKSDIVTFILKDLCVPRIV